MVLSPIEKIFLQDLQKTKKIGFSTERFTDLGKLNFPMVVRF